MSHAQLEKVGRVSEGGYYLEDEESNKNSNSNNFNHKLKLDSKMHLLQFENKLEKL